MIRVIHGHERSMFPREIDQMHRLRKKVFYDRMNWDVPIINTWEADGFDALDPVYLLKMDEKDQVIGTVRLLPTTGFTMINDVFSELLPDGAPIYSPRIWEGSRFAVDSDVSQTGERTAVSRAAIELLLAGNEIGMGIGMTHCVGVFDLNMHRLMKRIGCAGEPLAPPKRIGHVMCIAVLMEMGEETDARLRHLGGIRGEVIEPRTAPQITRKKVISHAA
jgi:N-acyl-L-homoserine lactone synthetase